MLTPSQLLSLDPATLDVLADPDPVDRELQRKLAYAVEQSLNTSRSDADRELMRTTRDKLLAQARSRSY